MNIKNNKGLSLVEVVVVLAIMAILTGIITISLGPSVSKPAEEAAEKAMNAMNSCRVTTMGKKEASLEFHINNGVVYVKETVEGVVVKDLPISEKSVNVTYKYKSGVEMDLATSPLIIKFDRSNGGFLPASGTEYCSEMTFSKGSREVKLKLYDITGKVSIEK